AVGNMPIAALASPDGRYLVLSLAGWREQGIAIIDRQSHAVVQEVPQRGAFLGLAWSADGRTLYSSGGATDLVYVYAWTASSARPATLVDSIALGHADGKTPGSRYPAGLAVGANGRSLYVAENLSDSIAVVDLTTRRVSQRVAADAYPYAVIARDGIVYVSAWGASTVNVFRADSTGRLTAERSIAVGRHPSALVFNADGSRLYVASASTDRIAVVDTRARRTIRYLLDPPPGGVHEGSTPNALALSADGARLFVAEADANAVAVFDLSTDSLVGRIPTQWYPTAVDVRGDSLWVVNGKGAGSGPNPGGLQPNVRLADVDPHLYTLGQLNGSVTVSADVRGALLDALSRRVAHANGWDVPRTLPRLQYPAFEHVVYIIKENRTYDQVLGDLPQGDGDTAFIYFPRAVSPNHHALAERFGLFDRFFVNAEVSNQGHPWSTSAYVTDFVEKTTPDDYRLLRPEHDDAGDADMPAAGFLWDAAVKKGLSVRDYGEYGEPDPRTPHDSGALQTRSVIASLAPHMSPTYPSFNLTIPDQRRADAWITEFRDFERTGRMPALEILHLPNDHTGGARRGLPTPKAYMADNDLALGRIVEAVSRSRFWKSTVIFVVEDDAQDGPDHVDSHRSVLLAVSAWNRRGVSHRFVNTTDVLATIEEILGLDALSHFDRFGRPLREIWTSGPDLSPYVALTPAQPLSELNVASGADAQRSSRIDLSRADRVNDEEFSRILWHSIKGRAAAFPLKHRAAVQEYVRAR
ncbi:MAG TPA: SMP-30/gluconolactonase/LRE family protein, partial [Gemmatimonadaceae bacterium]|nr:SMP-30/gluconolactonase/LRE family protein [Gemmatimonadaceae bacterium]